MLPVRIRSGGAPAQRRGVLLAIVAVLSLVLTPAAAAGADPTPPSDAPAAFDRPFFSGVFLGEEGSRTERVDGALAQFSRMVGKQPALVKTFHNLDVDFSAGGWAGQLVRRVHSAGSTNYIALDLRWRGAPHGNLLDAINSGRADREIARQMRGLATVGGPVLVSPAWEMNGNWGFAWQPHVNGGASTPDKYRRAFRRLVDIARREGATNVKWVFSPNVGNPYGRRAGPSHWNWYGHYYPGDKYVDYLGPHGYNGASLWGGAYQHFEEMFDGVSADHTLSDMERRYPGKPILVGEYATEEAGGQDKGEWIRRSFETMRNHPRIVGAIWFQMRKETDWRINSSGSGLDAYRAALADPNVRSEFR
jgi:hypothetical protein